MNLPARAWRCLPLLWALLLSGCGGYADFTLPVLYPTGSIPSFRFDPLPEPVLRPENGWEAADVLNPSVISGPGGALFNLYSAYDGHIWRTAVATSTDGLNWHKTGVVLAPDPKTWEGGYIAANGSALYVNSQFWYWYQAGARGTPRIGLARSDDGRFWRKETQPVLDLGPRGAWDERGVADPYVIRADGWFYLYYMGQDRARRQQLGVARSSDGIHWQKLRTNPVVEIENRDGFAENGLGEPAVWATGGSYWMLYTGRDSSENRRLGLARSPDGVRWTKLPVVFGGAEPWNSKIVCDPSVLVDGATIKVWFGGGDVASPDENLHGRIGFATLAK
jgi:predicted GH43/DUF377 family glycosyl hydrolase